jgi:hypothetical protein
MSNLKAQLELLRPWLKVSDKDLKKANEDDFFGNAGKFIQSAGKQVFDAGADATKQALDLIDKTQIEGYKRKSNNPMFKALGIDKKIEEDNQKRLKAIKQREEDSNQRTRDLAGDKAALDKKATLLTDKPKIFKNIANKEVQFAKETPAYYDNYVNQAVEAYEKQLRDAKFSDNKVNQFVSQARTIAQQKVAEAGQKDINDSRNLVNSLADPESVGGFNIERANIGFDEAEGKEIGLGRQIKASPITETGLRTVKPIIKTVNDISNLVLSAEDQTLGRVGNLITGKGFKAGDLANKSNEYDKQILNALPSVGGQNINQAVDVEQNLGTGFQTFAGNIIPFYFTPETNLARQGAALVGKNLPRGLARRMGTAGIKGLTDTPLSVGQTLGDLNTQVLDGNMTYGEALQQAPSAVLLNAATDIVGAGAFKGAGSLIRKGFKGLNVPKTPEIPTNQVVPEAQLPLAQPITPQQIRQNTYQTSVQKLAEIRQRNKTLTQELKQAELTGDYATAAKLKLEAKYIKTQTNFLKQTVNNLELKGLQEQAQALPSNSGLNQTAQDVARILGEETNPNLKTLQDGSIYSPSSSRAINRNNQETAISSLQTPYKPYKPLSEMQAKKQYEIARRTEFLNKQIKTLSIEASALKQGKKTWSGKTAADLPKIEENLNQFKAELKNLNAPKIQEVEGLKGSGEQIDEAVAQRPPKEVKVPEAPKSEIESVKNNTVNLNAPETPKVEGLKGSGKQIDKAVAQRPPKEVKQAQNELRNEYKNALSNESQLAEKPLRDGLEELGFEIKTNKKGDKFAQLGNVRISLKDTPPPYSLSGLKETYKNKIASAKAANDIRAGNTSVDNIASQFLDDIQTNKYLDEFDGEAAFKHKKLNDDLNNAKTYEELEKVGEEHADLIGTEGEYFDSYMKKLNELIREPEVKIEAPEIESESVKNNTQNLNVLEAQKVEELKGNSKQIDQVLQDAPKGEAGEIDKQMIRAFAEADPRSYALGKPPDIKTWKEFQELKRNPSNFKTLKEQAKEIGVKLSPDAQPKVDELVRVKKSLRDHELTAETLRDRLLKQMEKEGIKEIKTSNGTVLKAIDIKSSEVLNQEGRIKLEAFKQELYDSGKIGMKRGDDVLNVQPSTEAKLLTTRKGITTTKQLADDFEQIKSRKEALELNEELLKAEVKQAIKDLPDEGLRLVFRDSNGDAVVHASKGKQTFDIGAVKTEVDDYTALLKSKGYTQTKAASKQLRGKIDEAVRQKLVKEAIETGEIPNLKIAEAVIKDGLEDYKRINNGISGKQFAFNPLTAAVLLDGDAALVATRVFKQLVDEGVNKLKPEILTSLYDGLKTAVGRTESFATRLRNSKIPAFRKLIDEYETLAAKEYQAEGYIRTKLKAEEVESIGNALKEHGFKKVEDMIRKGERIEGIESVDQLEILKSFTNTRVKRAELIKKTMQDAERANFPPGELNMLKAFYDSETNTLKGTGKALQALATDFAYFKALWNNIRSTTLVATDPLTKLVPEFGITKTALSVKDVFFDPEVRKSPLFKAYNAGDSGTFIDALSARRTGKLSEAWKKVKKANIFGLATEISQDMGLLAHARSFNDYWKAKTGNNIDIVKDFDGLNEASQEFALMHNSITNKLYGSGKGNINLAEIESNNFIKPFMAFVGEPLRFQKRMTEWRSIIGKANEPGATPKDKEMALRARNSMLTFVAMTVILGGSQAIKNQGGALGGVYNAVLNQSSPEQKQQIEDTMDAFQFTNLIYKATGGKLDLNIDLGEKLGTSIFPRGEGEGFIDTMKKAASGDNKILAIDMLKQFPKDTEKAINYFKAGNTEQGLFTLAKIFLGAPVGTIDKALKKFNQEPISVWVEGQGGSMKEEFKAVDLADILSYSKNENDIKKAVRMEEKAKESVIGQVEKVGKSYRLKGKNKNFNEYLNLLSSERFKLNPATSKEELKNELLKKAFTKQQNRDKKLLKFAPKNSSDFVKSQSKEDLIKQVHLLKGRKKEEALKAIREAQSESNSRGRSKFSAVLQELEG